MFCFLCILGSPPDFYQGFGRVSMKNVLPYTGIDTVLDLYVDEFAIAPLSTVSYNVRLTSTSRPLKVNNKSKHLFRPLISYSFHHKKTVTPNLYLLSRSLCPMHMSLTHDSHEGYPCLDGPTQYHHQR